jgi:hypothetical protein
MLDLSKTIEVKKTYEDEIQTFKDNIDIVKKAEFNIPPAIKKSATLLLSKVEKISAPHIELTQMNKTLLDIIDLNTSIETNKDLKGLIERAQTLNTPEVNVEKMVRSTILFNLNQKYSKEEIKINVNKLISKLETLITNYDVQTIELKKIAPNLSLEVYKKNIGFQDCETLEQLIAGFKDLNNINSRLLAEHTLEPPTQEKKSTENIFHNFKDQLLKIGDRLRPDRTDRKNTQSSDSTVSSAPPPNNKR